MNIIWNTDPFFFFILMLDVNWGFSFFVCVCGEKSLDFTRNSAWLHPGHKYFLKTNTVQLETVLGWKDLLVIFFVFWILICLLLYYFCSPLHRSCLFGSTVYMHVYLFLPHGISFNCGIQGLWNTLSKLVINIYQWKTLHCVWIHLCCPERIVCTLHTFEIPQPGALS